MDGETKEAFIIKNTFLELPHDSAPRPIRRSFSGSDLSSPSQASVASVHELKEWAESKGSNSDSAKASRDLGIIQQLWDSSSDSNNRVSSPALDAPRDARGVEKDRKGQKIEKNLKPNQAEPHELHDEHPPPAPEAISLYQNMLALAGPRNLKPETLDRLNKEMLHVHIPVDEEGRKTSIGSIMHFQRPVGKECRPCVFWFQEHCERGVLCLYCHIAWHRESVQFKRIRPSKSTRQRRKQQLALAESQDQAARLNVSDNQAHTSSDVFSHGTRMSL